MDFRGPEITQGIGLLVAAVAAFTLLVGAGMGAYVMWVLL